jgi:hypothetical protein
MEPTLQFDPANLSIWYSPVPDDAIHEIARLALVGEQADARDRVLALDNHELRVRAAHMLSAVVHEQRHFVDMLLTNFGQSMIRQFASLLVNVPAAIKAAESQGELALPVTIYGDPVKRMILGVTANDDLAKIAHDVRDRAHMLNPDMFEHTHAKTGAISIGGRAQIEALGFMTQIALLQKEFGLRLAREVQEEMPDRVHMRNQYGWTALLGSALGLTPAGDLPAGAFSVLMPALGALLYGTLMVRRWGQTQCEVEGGNTAFAAARFDPLFVYFRSTGRLARATSTREAWQVVDQACGDLFGLSAREELENDLQHEARFCEAAEDLFGKGTAVANFLLGVHEARLRLVALFDESPENIIDLGRYGNLLNAIDPVPIFVNPAGGVDKHEDGWVGLWRGASELGKFGKVTWSWASAPAGITSAGGRIHIVKDVESWKSVVMDMIPLSKLLLRGRRQALVLGPELDHAEILLNQFGIECRYDPLLSAPIVETSSDAFWYLTARPSAICDSCSAQVARGSGHYVPAVLFRKNDRIANWLVQKFGGGEFGLFQARKDWTGWLLCDICHAGVTQLVAAQSRRTARG